MIEQINLKKIVKFKHDMRHIIDWAKECWYFMKLIMNQIQINAIYGF